MIGIVTFYLPFGAAFRIAPERGVSFLETIKRPTGFSRKRKCLMISLPCG